MTAIEKIVCPETQMSLRRLPRRQAEEVVGERLRAAEGRGYVPVGPTEEVLVRSDGAAAYPVHDGIPVLLVPEMLVPETSRRTFDISHPWYAEAYEEMDFYASEAQEFLADVEGSLAARDLTPLSDLDRRQQEAFPEPRRSWLDAKYELAAQADAYGHLRRLTDCRVMQVGGNGLHAVKFLLAGAAEAWLISPVIGEVAYGRALAHHVGVADRFHGVAAIAEQLPFPPCFFDRVFSQGCVHHWVTKDALPECHRVLKPGGRFAAVEPWRAPGYGIGTKVLGKRQREVSCVVLTADRVVPHLAAFESARIEHHWALSRYPLIALDKLGLRFGREAVWRIGALDDALTDRMPRLRATGSSVAILAVK